MDQKCKMVMNFICLFLFFSVCNKIRFPWSFHSLEGPYKHKWHSLKVVGILEASETKYGSPSCSAPGLTHAWFHGPGEQIWQISQSSWVRRISRRREENKAREDIKIIGKITFYKKPAQWKIFLVQFFIQIICTVPRMTGSDR